MSAQSCEWSAVDGSFYKDWVYGIADGDKGSVVLSGYFTESGTFGTYYVEAAGETQDYFVANYSKTGRLIWVRTGGGAFNDVAYDVASDRWGNVYTTGSFIEQMSIEDTVLYGESEQGNAFLAAYDWEGNFQYAQRLGNSYQDVGYGIACGRNDRISCTGYGSNSNQGMHQLFLKQYNSSGELLWEHWAGEEAYSEGWKVVTNAQNEVFLMGITTSSITLGNCSFDTDLSTPQLFVAKFSENGDCLWINHIAQTSLDRSGDLEIDTEGNILLTGHYTSDNNFGYFKLKATDQRDAFIVKLNPDGTFIWVKRGSGRGFAEGLGLSIDQENNIFVAGYFEQTMLLDLNPFQSEGWDDMFIAKYNATGGCEWLEHIGGKGHERAQGIHVNQDGDIYLTGAIGQEVEFYGCAISSNDCGEFKWLNCEDIFLVKLNDNTRSIYQKKPNETRLISSSFESTSRALLVQFYQAEGSTIDLQVVDVAGRIIFNRQLDAAYQSEINLQIPLPYFATGIYFITLSVDGRMVDSKKAFL